MKLRYAFVLAVLPLTGCAGLGVLVGGGSVAQVAPATITQAEKSLTLAHLAYDGLGATLKAAATTGVLHGSAAANAKTYYDKAGDALLVADKADDAANASGVMAAISTANDAIVQAKSLAKGN